MKKELVVVFEDQQPIRRNMSQNNVNFDLDYLIKVGKVKITNEDGTLVLKVDGNTTNIDTDVIQRYDNRDSFPKQGKEKVLYIDLEESEIYYWTNNGYQLLSEYNEIIDTSSTFTDENIKAVTKNPFLKIKSGKSIYTPTYIDQDTNTIFYTCVDAVNKCTYYRKINWSKKTISSGMYLNTTVVKSDKNGNIRINDAETTVYRLPNEVVHNNKENVFTNKNTFNEEVTLKKVADSNGQQGEAGQVLTYGEGGVEWRTPSFKYIDINDGITDEHVAIVTQNPQTLIHCDTYIFTPTYFEGDLGDMYYTCVEGDEQKVYVLNIDWNSKSILEKFGYNLGSSGGGNSKIVLELSMTMGQEIILTKEQADIFLNNSLDDIEIKIYDEDYGYYYYLNYSYTSDEDYKTFTMFDGSTLYYADYYVDGDEHFLYYDSFEPHVNVARTASINNTFTNKNTFNNDIQMKKVLLPVSPNSNTYGYGQSGQVLMSNGSSTYWGTPHRNLSVKTAEDVDYYDVTYTNNELTINVSSYEFYYYKLDIETILQAKNILEQDMAEVTRIRIVGDTNTKVFLYLPSNQSIQTLEYVDIMARNMIFINKPFLDLDLGIDGLSNYFDGGNNNVAFCATNSSSIDSFTFYIEYDEMGCCHISYINDAEI